MTMSDGEIKAIEAQTMAILAADMNQAENVLDSVLKGMTLFQLRMSRTILNSAVSQVETEMRAKGMIIPTTLQFSRDGE